MSEPGLSLAYMAIRSKNEVIAVYVLAAALLIFLCWTLETVSSRCLDANGDTFLGAMISINCVMDYLIDEFQTLQWY
jgi:hypothetical protein